MNPTNWILWTKFVPDDAAVNPPDLLMTSEQNLDVVARFLERRATLAPFRDKIIYFDKLPDGNFALESGPIKLRTVDDGTHPIWKLTGLACHVATHIEKLGRPVRAWQICADADGGALAIAFAAVYGHSVAIADGDMGDLTMALAQTMGVATSSKDMPFRGNVADERVKAAILKWRHNAKIH